MTPLVGREPEIALLLEGWERAKEGDIGAAGFDGTDTTLGMPSDCDANTTSKPN